jgi:DNA polymerase-3 subunit delta
VGTSLRGIQSELDKLYLYVSKRRTITVADVQAVVGMSKEFNIFELQNALAGKDVRRSTEILERMLEAGESATMMIAMLTRFFATLWKLHDMRRRGVRTQEQARGAGINPFFLREYQSALNQYPASEVEHAFSLLAAADEGLKSTSTDPKQIMHSLITQLLLSEFEPVR